MGLTMVMVEVGNPADLTRMESVDFLVDSGAIYSVVPEEVLTRLGIKSYAEQEFRLANGELIRRRKGMAAFRMGDKVGGADVIFGEPGDSMLLGAFTLEALGFALDPMRKDFRYTPHCRLTVAGRGSAAARSSGSAIGWPSAVGSTPASRWCRRAAWESPGRG